MGSWNITSYSKNELTFSHLFMLIADEFWLNVPKIAKKGT